MAANHGGDPDGPRRIGPLQIAIALALVPAVGIAATGAVKQLRAQHVVAVVPAPTAAPAPVARSHPDLASTVPVGVDVVYWANWDGALGPPYTLHAVDWSGRDRGTIALPATSDGGRAAQQPAVAASPDGRALLVDRDVYAANGSWLGQMPFGGQTLWADDSQHLCHMSPLPGANGVQVDLLGPDGILWATARLPTTEAESGDSPSLLSCSANAMRADVLLSTTMQGVANEVMGLDLQAGRAPVQRPICTGDCVGSPVASPDGQLFAYVDAARHPVVVSMASGATQRLETSGWPVAFSGDSRALVVALDAVGSGTTLTSVPGLQLLDWRTGRVVWSRSDGQTVPQWALPLPGPGVVAVAACDYRPGTGAFPSGPCGLDILTATAGGGTTSTHAGQGLDFAFSAGPF